MAGPGLGYYLFNISLEMYIHFSYENTDKNIAYSPFSLAAALSMTLAGARGNTADELSNVLHVEKGVENVEWFSKALCDLSTRNVKFRLANRMYTARQFPPRNEYEALLEDSYRATIKSVDFESNPEAVRKEANEYVSKKTENKIRDFLPAGSVREETKFILINAIYFKANWEDYFDLADTISAVFHLNSANRVKVDTMRAEGSYTMGRSADLKCRALEKPYKGGEYSMVILLPDDVDGLSFLEEQLTEHNLYSLLKNLELRKYVQLSLPRFKVESKMSVKNILEALGVNDLFEEGSADLSGMFEGGGPAVGDIIHQAVVEVKENGTEAAAATAEISDEFTGQKEDHKPTEFIVDHPFMFLIKNKRDNLILFIGSVRNPALG